MSSTVEYIIVGLIVAAAVLALGIKLVRFVRGAKPGCGSGCGSCSANTSTSRHGTEKPLVQLQSFPVQKRR